MRISVITPTYNSVKYIADCIENVASQNVHALEHIVIDGGSTDGTVDRLRALVEQYPHLTFVSEKDRGQSDAMNKGLKMASGDVVGFLNVDDYYEPGAIDEALALLNTHASLDMVVGACRAINEDGSTQFWNRPNDLRLEAMMLGWIYYQFPCNPSAYFYRRRIHDVVPYYNVEDHYAMDFEFILHCACHIKMSFFDRHWGNYRVIPGTKTFEDRPNGAARIAAIARKFKPGLSLAQRFNMRLLKARTRLGWSYIDLKWVYWNLKGRVRSAL